MKRNLTGRYYFKPTWRGLVLMVEHKIPGDIPYEWETKWAKARQCDLPYLDITIKTK